MTAPRILLVDDDAELASVISDLLAPEGFEVKWVRGVFAAVRAIEEHETCLILLDLALPDGEGVEVMRRIGKAPPVIIVSAAEPMHLSAAARSIDAFSYLRKPFDTEELLRNVRAALGVSPPPPSSV